MLILIRGLPGSGKSTFAREYFSNEAAFRKMPIQKYIHLEADMYYTDHEGNYNFTRENLRNAHHWCQETANYGSIHNVPEEVLKKMADRFEDYEGETYWPFDSRDV